MGVHDQKKDLQPDPLPIVNRSILMTNCSHPSIHPFIQNREGDIPK